MAAGPAQPGHADPLAGAGDPADDLVAGHDRQRPGDVAVHHMQIGPAHAAGRDLDQELARTGLGHRPLDHAQRQAGPIELHRAHHPRNLSLLVIPAKAGISWS